jgi:diguanylate cyclase (GGDEF)-like protein
MADETGHEARLFLRHKEGRRVPIANRTQPLRGADGSVVGGIEIFSDDTAQVESRRKAEEMSRMAFLDHLTQVPNRRFLEIALRTAFDEFEAHKSPFGILLIDLDRFKEVNDVWGHASGDAVLKATARTLSGALRGTDVVGRWGGDEFLAIVRNVNEDVLDALARRCVALVSQLTLAAPSEGRKAMASISVGAALAAAGEPAEELLRRADERLYRSKFEGRGGAMAAWLRAFPYLLRGGLLAVSRSFAAIAFSELLYSDASGPSRRGHPGAPTFK